jgi:hypothetical protein
MARALRQRAQAIADADARTGVLFTALYYEALADQLERIEESALAHEEETAERDSRPPVD